ncbi:MAG: LysR family transcriptional regulator, partial [Myxococcota bacterium]
MTHGSTVDEIWRWLPLVKLIAEQQSVTRAARIARISPPAASKALAQVERELDVKLFDRTGNRLVLNPRG